MEIFKKIMAIVGCIFTAVALVVGIGINSNKTFKDNMMDNLGVVDKQVYDSLNQSFIEQGQIIDGVIEENTQLKEEKEHFDEISVQINNAVVNYNGRFISFDLKTLEDNYLHYTTGVKLMCSGFELNSTFYSAVESSCCISLFEYDSYSLIIDGSVADLQKAIFVGTCTENTITNIRVIDLEGNNVNLQELISDALYSYEINCDYSVDSENNVLTINIDIIVNQEV